MQVHAAAAYEDPLRLLFWLKSDQSTWRVKSCTYYMGLFAMQSLPFDYLVPMPAHWGHVAYGLNPARGDGQRVRHADNKPVLMHLQEVRATKRQPQCESHERVKNVEGAFALAVDPLILKGCSLLLVDDLMTTGATLHAAGSELIQANPKEISRLWHVGCCDL